MQVFTPEAFRQLSEDTREQMGLRAIDLHRVLPPRNHSLAPVSDPILELNNVALHYKKRIILHDISYSSKGEVIGVVGHNGAENDLFPCFVRASQGL